MSSTRRKYSRVRAVSRVSLSTKLFEISPRIIVSRIAFHNSFIPSPPPDVGVNDANLKYTLERTTHPLLFYTLQQFPILSLSLSLSFIQSSRSNPISSRAAHEANKN